MEVFKKHLERYDANKVDSVMQNPHEADGRDPLKTERGAV